MPSGCNVCNSRIQKLSFYKRVPLVLTYHPSLEKIAGIVIIGKKLKKVKRGQVIP
jgi:hypothetical protein